MAELEAGDIARLGWQLRTETDLIGVLRRVVGSAVDEIPGAEHAGITLIDNGGFSSPVVSAPIIDVVDAAQYECRQGPCLTAAVDGTPIVQVDDLATDARWPQFAPRATELGIRSMMSFHLFDDRGTLGALNLYSGRPGAFDSHSEHVGEVLIAQAAIATTTARREADLRVALESRDIIGQAKGILMERLKINSTEAFDLLIVASQRMHRKLRDIAEELAATGEFPGA